MGPSLEDRLYICSRCAADTRWHPEFFEFAPPGLGPEIAPFVMAVPFPASHHIDPIGAFFKGPQDMERIHFAGTGNTNNLDARRVPQAHRTCQVRGRVPSEIAAKGDDDRFKCLTHRTRLQQGVDLAQELIVLVPVSSMALAGHSAAQMPQP